MSASIFTIMKLREQLEDGPDKTKVQGIAGQFEIAQMATKTRQNKPSQFQQERPRVEIKVSIGQATGHRHIFTDNSTAYDEWSFILAAQFVTAPNPDPAQNMIHSDYVAKGRDILFNLAQRSWNDTDNFPNLLIAEPLRDAGTDDYLKADDGVEYTTLSYAGIVRVRSAAWPDTP